MSSHWKAYDILRITVETDENWLSNQRITSTIFSMLKLLLQVKQLKQFKSPIAIKSQINDLQHVYGATRRFGAFR